MHFRMTHRMIPHDCAWANQRAKCWINYPPFKGLTSPVIVKKGISTWHVIMFYANPNNGSCGVCCQGSLLHSHCTSIETGIQRSHYSPRFCNVPFMEVKGHETGVDLESPSAKVCLKIKHQYLHEITWSDYYPPVETYVGKSLLATWRNWRFKTPITNNYIINPGKFIICNFLVWFISDDDDRSCGTLIIIMLTSSYAYAWWINYRPGKCLTTPIHAGWFIIY